MKRPTNCFLINLVIKENSKHPQNRQANFLTWVANLIANSINISKRQLYSIELVCVRLMIIGIRETNNTSAISILKRRI